MVRLTLIDVATQKRIGETTVSPEQLPETFARETTMHIGGDDWHVVSADPQTRAECVATGKLRLELAKLTQMAPQDVLFSMPSIENAMPKLVDGDVRGALKLHEDLWRQREVVAPKFADIVEAERAKIRAVWSGASAGPGALRTAFRECYLRERIPVPLEGVELLLSAIEHGPRRAICIGAYLVAGGFAYDHDGVLVFGTEVDGVITTLCADPDVAPLVPIAERLGLLAVDWLARP